jgi:3-hexulose-6-phosphate synthase
MDAGELEADHCFEAGADIVTVLGASNDATVAGVVRSAKKHGGKVMADMIEVHNLKERALQIEKLGVNYICVHTAFDIQNTGKDPLDELIEVNKVLTKAQSAVAGGVKVHTARQIAAEHPAILVVGGGITNAQDRALAAKTIKEIMNSEEASHE